MHRSPSHISIYSILVYCHCASLSFTKLNIFYIGILPLCTTLLQTTQYILYWYTAIVHHSSSHNSIYSILVYCHCAPLFFTQLNIFYIGILPLCTTLLHTTQYILYWYTAIVHHSSSHNSIYSILVCCHCAPLFFTQLNIFYIGILPLCTTLLHTTQYILYWYTAIVHHSSSNNSIYSILVYCHCAPLFFTQLNIFYIGILPLCTTLLHTTQYILYWYTAIVHHSSSNNSIYSILVYCHCAPLFFTQLNIFYIGILPLCTTLLHTTQYILYWYTVIVYHTSSHNSMISKLVYLPLCTTLLHTNKYILYWYTAIVHHTSSHNSIYSILVCCHCAPYFFTQLNVLYIGIFAIVHHTSSHK